MLCAALAMFKVLPLGSCRGLEHLLFDSRAHTPPRERPRGSPAGRWGCVGREGRRVLQDSWGRGRAGLDGINGSLGFE
jgi:hypothetical protein